MTRYDCDGDYDDTVNYYKDEIDFDDDDEGAGVVELLDSLNDVMLEFDAYC